MQDHLKPCRVRFAPSPTGHLHIGGARTALYNYLLARQMGGQFILRIEDTDRKRYVEGAEEEIINQLHWLGIDYDEGPDIGGPYGPYRQSLRRDIYTKYAQELIAKGNAFYCFCTPEKLEKTRQEQMKSGKNPHYDGTCREMDPEEAHRRVQSGERHVVRFKTPKTGITRVVDHLRGEIKVENSLLDDFILVKSDGLALYHLAAMVDDHLMKISHVIRSSEWLPTFPLHHLIYHAFGWEEPTWIHLSVFLKPSGKGKMSKREAADLAKDGYSIFVKDLGPLGYIPEAVNNWIALMGWSFDDQTEFFTLKDLVERFSIDRLNPSPAAINFSKFDHFNGLHIRSLPDVDLATRVKPFFEKAGYEVNLNTLLKIIPLIRERLATLDEAPGIAGFFFSEKVTPQVEDLIPKGMTAVTTIEVAEKCLEILSNVAQFSTEETEPPMRKFVEEAGLTAGQVFGFLRVCVTGQKVSPPLFESMEIIGKETVLHRVREAIQLLR